jgi:hypothetical protein
MLAVAPEYVRCGDAVSADTVVRVVTYGVAAATSKGN